MFSKTEFKSNITNKIYTIEINLNDKISNVFDIIKYQLLNLLELSQDNYKIILYTLTNEKIEENDETSLANYCDCIEYPSFYFKPILYTDLASNLQPMDTSNLIQQNEPNSDSDSSSEIISDDDTYNDDTHNHDMNYNDTLLTQ